MHKVKDVQVGAVLKEHGVELVVEFGEPARVKVCEALAHFLVDLASEREVFSGDVGRRHRGGHALDEAERLHRVLVFARVDGNDLGAYVRRERDEALGLESANRLAHGNNADVEFLGNLTEYQPETGAVGALGDRLLDGDVGTLALAHRDGAHFLPFRQTSKRFFHSASMG